MEISRSASDTRRFEDHVPERHRAALRRRALLSSLDRFLGALLRECPEHVTFLPSEKIDARTAKVLGMPERVAWIASRRALGKGIWVGVSRSAALGRIEVVGVGIDGGASVRAVEDLASFGAAFLALGLLRGREGELLMDDLASSARNLHLGLCLRERWRPDFASRYPGLLREGAEDADAAASLLEAWCALGHPLHPTPKSRGEMDCDPEVLAELSPEALRDLPVELVAAPVGRVDYGHADGIGYDEFLRSVLPGLCADGGLLRILQAKGLAWRNVRLIPMHPWQLAHLPPEEAKEIRPLGVRLPSRALLSFRTVVPADGTRHLKLPLEACLTSAVRQLSPRSVRHAVAMSRLLSGLSREGRLSQRFAFQRDEAFLFLSRKVSCIFRDRLQGLVPEGCVALPVAALLEESPTDRNRSILQDLVKRFGKGREDAGTAMAFLARYAEVVVPDVLKLLSMYGIGCEAHMQNCLVAFRDGVPERLILRDAEDLPVCLERFERQFPRDSIPTGTWNVPEGPELARKVVAHSLLHAHLGFLARELSLRFGIRERDLWDVLKGVLEAAFADLAAQGVPDAESDRNWFFAPTTFLKCLLRMKLLGRVGNEFVYREVENPLAATAPQQAS